MRTDDDNDGVNQKSKSERFLEIRRIVNIKSNTPNLIAENDLKSDSKAPR